MALINLFPEKQIIERIVANDRAVLGELFVRYEQMVLRYLQSHGGSKTDAEDMLQEALIVVWQKSCSGDFELTSKLSTYVMAIVKNKWRAECRKRRRFDTEASEDPVDGQPSSLETLISREQTDAVRVALQALNSPCRDLLLLYYFERRPFKSIARILGFSNAAVAKSKKYQCKKRLEKLLTARLQGMEKE